MRAGGLQAIQTKRFKSQTTDSKRTLASPNLFKDIDTTRYGAGEVIVGDITYIYLQGGRFCYLAMWQDVVTKRIVGRIDKTRSSYTFRQRQSICFKQIPTLVKSKGLLQSMSGIGNCYDNAMAESFFSRVQGGVNRKRRV